MCRNRLEKESEAPAKISAPIPSQIRREYKRNQACMSEFYKEKNSSVPLARRFSCKIKGEDNFIVTVEGCG